MNRAARTVLVLALLAGAGFVLYGLAGSGESATAPSRFVSSRQCQECHPGVYAEWETSHHALSWLCEDVRRLSNDFENPECRTCHAPRPVFDTGLAQPPLARESRQVEGVDCIACHQGAQGMVGVSEGLAGACAPTPDLRLRSPEFCAGCHDQHDTVKEWRATPFAQQGVVCTTCHMPEVDRPLASGRGTRRGAKHAFRGAHDLDMLRSAVRLTATLEERAVRVSVKNVGAGHHFPTDARHRAADLIARVLDASGSVREVRKLDRYRNPYRDEALPSTLLPYGEERRYEVAVPEGPGKVEVSLFYKLTPYPIEAEAILEDPGATLLYREVVPF